ncbi:unnamed protein product [Linum tenue]|uniref:Uncharacterized protein n=1 Tax=Linum tenue TaxID=586396 RepID=A0AAV0KCE9_9ROSI|nr:unnamed protein product [Linum tenue]
MMGAAWAGIVVVVSSSLTRSQLLDRCGRYHLQDCHRVDPTDEFARGDRSR